MIECALNLGLNQLTHIDMYANEAMFKSDEFFEMFTQLLLNNQSQIKQLKVGGNLLNESQSATILRILSESSMQTLEHLDISNSDLSSEESHICLAALIVAAPALKYVDVSYQEGRHVYVVIEVEYATEDSDG